jgi:hypothetical protein
MCHIKTLNEFFSKIEIQNKITLQSMLVPSVNIFDSYKQMEEVENNEN